MEGYKEERQRAKTHVPPPLLPLEDNRPERLVLHPHTRPRAFTESDACRPHDVHLEWKKPDEPALVMEVDVDDDQNPTTPQLSPRGRHLKPSLAQPQRVRSISPVPTRTPAPPAPPTPTPQPSRLKTPRTRPPSTPRTPKTAKVVKEYTLTPRTLKRVVSGRTSQIGGTTDGSKTPTSARSKSTPRLIPPSLATPRRSRPPLNTARAEGSPMNQIKQQLKGKYIGDHLRARPTAGELVSRNIMTTEDIRGVDPLIQQKGKALTRRIAGENIEKSLQNRPPREELKRRHILHDSTPALPTDKHAVEKHLETFLEHRPVPEDLEERNILRGETSAPVKERRVTLDAWIQGRPPKLSLSQKHILQDEDLAMDQVSSELQKLLSRRPDLEEIIKRNMIQEQLKHTTQTVPSATAVAKSVRTRTTSRGNIYGFVIVIVGKHLWGASGDENIGIYDVENGQFVRRLRGHTRMVKTIVEARDHTVWSGSYDTTIAIWSKESILSRVLEGHKGGIKCMTLVGETMWSGANDGKVCTWDVHSFQLLREASVHTRAVNCLCASPSQGEIWTGSDDKTIRVLDMATSREKKRISAHTGYITCMTSVEEHIWVGADDRTLSVWNKKTYHQVKRLHGHTRPIRDLLYHKGGCVFSASSDGTVRVWNPKTFTLVRDNVADHTFGVQMMAMCDKGLVIAYVDRTIKLVDLKSFKVITTYKVVPATEFKEYVPTLQEISDDSRRVSMEPLETEEEEDVETTDEDVEIPGDMVSFIARFLEHTAKEDDVCKRYTPIAQTAPGIWGATRDGVLLCKTIDHYFQGVVDDRVLHIPDADCTLLADQMVDNLNVCINSCRAIGCEAVSVRPLDFFANKVGKIAEFAWQVVETCLFRNVSVAKHPEIVRLLKADEDIKILRELSPEDILLRWVNHHLAEAGSERRVTNFENDFQDAAVYSILLHRVAPDHCPADLLSLEDPRARVEAVLHSATSMKCDTMAEVDDILHGNKWVNVAFLAELFHLRNGLETCVEPVTDFVETREMRALRVWLNRLGIDSMVTHLFEDLSSGIALLQMLDKIEPGIIDWSQVAFPSEKALNIFQKVGNCNLAVDRARSLKFSLINIGGKDVADEQPKPILSVVWQAMRYDYLKFLSTVKFDGKEVTEGDLVQWCNEKVRAGGSSLSIRSFNDVSLRSGRFFIELLASIALPGTVDRRFVREGNEREDFIANAKYVISTAWKMGCHTFVQWEDIVELNSGMLLKLVADLMLLSLYKK